MYNKDLNNNIDLVISTKRNKSHPIVYDYCLKDPNHIRTLCMCSQGFARSTYFWKLISNFLLKHALFNNVCMKHGIVNSRTCVFKEDHRSCIASNFCDTCLVLYFGRIYRNLGYCKFFRYLFRFLKIFNKRLTGLNGYLSTIVLGVTCQNLMFAF